MKSKQEIENFIRVLSKCYNPDEHSPHLRGYIDGLIWVLEDDDK